MHFIELTDRYGTSIIVNFDRVEKIFKVTECGETFTNLVIDGNFLYVQETYQQIKDSLI